MSAPLPARFAPWWKTLLREPLVQFLLMAGVILAGYHFLGRPLIEISPQAINGARLDYEANRHRPASPEVLERLKNEYIEDEVLYREALRTGLTKDNRVRALLVQTMRSALRPIVPEPSEDDLKKLRAETPEVYRFPAEVSFEHVSFNDPGHIPPGLLQRLREGLSREGLGEPLPQPLANPLPATFHPQLEHVFGHEFTKQLEACPLQQWQGPYQSERGWHFIRVLTRSESRDMPLDELRLTLAAKWTGIEENWEISRKVAELRKRYRVSAPSK